MKICGNRNCDEHNPGFSKGQRYCKVCAKEYYNKWQKVNKVKLARYYKKRNVDSSFDVIAPRYLKPPRRRAESKKTVCDRCPSHPRCKIYVKLDLAVDCEKISKSDVPFILGVGDTMLKETGWIDRVQLWDDTIWKRYNDAVTELQNCGTI